MADKSSIEWTDATWNPVTGCSRVSAGCEHCYAERLAATRMRNHPSRAGLTDSNGRWNGEVRFNGQWLDQPLHWSRPRRIFVAAHSDLFHEGVPDEWVNEILAVMSIANKHVFQVLTKRPARMREYFSDMQRCEEVLEIAHRKLVSPLPCVPDNTPTERDLTSIAMQLQDDSSTGFPWPPVNIELGVSAENQLAAARRISELLQIPASAHWASLEPLLGPIRLDDLQPSGMLDFNSLVGRSRMWPWRQFHRLRWVVVGGESGPGYRPMDPEWARSIRDQCASANVAFFMKQMAGKQEIPADLMVRQMPGRRA